MASSREAELEASGRANGLQFAVNALQNEVSELRHQNKMLIDRLLGAATMTAHTPMVGGIGLPPVVGGVPAGSPRQAPHPTFDPALPPPPEAAPTRGSHANDYGLGNLNTMAPFVDIGDEEAERQGIRLDEVTGTLETMSLPPRERRQ